jgi:hypothetical protein
MAEVLYPYDVIETQTKASEMSRELYMRRIQNAYNASQRCQGGSWGRGYWNTVVDQLHRNYWRGVEENKNDLHR